MEKQAYVLATWRLQVEGKFACLSDGIKQEYQKLFAYLRERKK